MELCILPLFLAEIAPPPLCRKHHVGHMCPSSRQYHRLSSLSIMQRLLSMCFVSVPAPVKVVIVFFCIFFCILLNCLPYLVNKNEYKTCHCLALETTLRQRACFPTPGPPVPALQCLQDREFCAIGKV